MSYSKACSYTFGKPDLNSLYFWKKINSQVVTLTIVEIIRIYIEPLSVMYYVCHNMCLQI